MKKPQQDWLVEGLSNPRPRPYLEASNNDVSLALEVNVSARLTDAYQLLKYVNPSARKWAQEMSRVREIASRCP